MGFFSALKNWAEDDFYDNPGLSKNKPTCDDLFAELKEIHQWLLNNAEVTKLSTSASYSFNFTLSISSKYGNNKYILPKDKVNIFKSLCDTFVDNAKKKKVEIERIPIRAGGSPHYRGDASKYYQITKALSGIYMMAIKEFDYITKNVYVKG
mgnify:CR=1 FL=1